MIQMAVDLGFSISQTRAWSKIDHCWVPSEAPLCQCGLVLSSQRNVVK